MNTANMLSAFDSAGFHAMRALFALTWQSGIVLCAAGFVSLLLRKQCAAARRAVWITALFAVPILPWLVELESRIDIPQAPVPVMRIYAAPDKAAPAQA